MLFCLEVRPGSAMHNADPVVCERRREEGPFPGGSGGETHQEVARGRGQGHRHRTVLQADNRKINVTIGNKHTYM
jgi:hypothetical protein